MALTVEVASLDGSVSIDVFFTSCMSRLFLFSGLFIVDGVITIPIALLGLILMPDLPTTTKPSIFYTQEQLDIAIKRMETVGRKPPEKFTKEKVRLGFRCADVLQLLIQSDRFSAFFLHGIYTRLCPVSSPYPPALI